jgi:hypothetical protein
MLVVYFLGKKYYTPLFFHYYYDAKQYMYHFICQLERKGLLFVLLIMKQLKIINGLLQTRK